MTVAEVIQVLSVLSGVILLWRFLVIPIYRIARDVDVTRTDTQATKVDVIEIKNEIAGINGEVVGIKDEVKAVNGRLTSGDASFANIINKIDSQNSRVSTHGEQIAAIDARLESHERHEE